MEEELSTFGVHLDFDTGKVSVKSDVLGFKLTAADGTAVRVVQMQSLAFSMLAPYRGWDALRGGAQSDFDVYLTHS